MELAERWRRLDVSAPQGLTCVEEFRLKYATLCASHAPLIHRTSGGRVGETFESSLRATGAWIEEFAPDLVIEFFPDHFNGFFYDSMPNFCVGLHATSVGDWDTKSGPLQVPTEMAEALVDAVRAQDVDVDVSHQMNVDHGFTQLWEVAAGGFDRFKTIPIMINCAAPPRPPLRRARLLGQAVGTFARSLNKRVLFVGSGGLSHDPPIPNMATAGPEQRAFLIGGRNPSTEARRAREARVMAAAQASATQTSNHLPPDEHWDLAFVDLLRTRELTKVDAWTETDLSAKAGCGGHEVRTWVAAFAALAAAGGDYSFELDSYAIVPEWMTGMGVARGWCLKAA